MGSLAHPSVFPPPPAPGEPLRAKPLHRAWLTPLPKLKVTNPARERGRREAAESVDTLMRRRGVSSVEVAEALVINPKLIDGWRTAEEGIQLGDLRAMARAGAKRLAIAILENEIEQLSHNEV